MYVTIENLTKDSLNNALQEEIIKLNSQYIKFVCDCIYGNKLNDVITFKEFCENYELEQRAKWENNFKSFIEDNKDWF